MENSQLENFKKNLQLRIIALTSLMVFLWIVYIFSINMIQMSPQSSHGLDNFKTGVQFGFGAGLYIVILVFWIKAIHAVRNPDKLKSLYIAETDERKLFIKQKSGTLGAMITLVGLIIGIVVSGVFDDTVFLTLLGAYFFVAFVHAGLKLYYTWKY